MEALNIFATRGGFAGAIHLDCDAGSSCVVWSKCGRRKKDCCSESCHATCMSRYSNFRCRFSSGSSKVNFFCFREPKTRFFVASFALTLALKDSAVGSEGAAEEVAFGASVPEDEEPDSDVEPRNPKGEKAERGGGGGEAEKPKDEILVERSSSRLNVRALAEEVAFRASVPDDEEPDSVVEPRNPKGEKAERGGGGGRGEAEKPKDEILVEKSSSRLDVRALARCLWNARTADEVDDAFNKLEALPTPAVYCSLIRGFGIDKKIESAFALVEWLKMKREESADSISPNLFIYNSLLGALKQAQQFEEIDRVMKDMAEQGISPNIVTYNSLMSVCIEWGRPREALDVLVTIEEAGLSPSPVTCSTALLAYWRMEDAYGALEFYVGLRDKYLKGEIGKGEAGEDVDKNWDDEFAKLGNFMIRICYQVMRQWLVKNENPTTSVVKLLIEMDKAQVSLTRVEYEKLIWACTREGHYMVAQQLYRRLREMNSGISLSVCNHAIWLMGKAKKWWAALEIYEDLLDKGPKPNNLSYELIMSHFNILLSAASKRGIWRWGIRLINKMQDKGLRPGSREWNAVLVACSKASEASEAVQIFRRMIEQGEKPTILSYGALLSALEKGKLYDEALKVWEHMCKVGIKPNLYAYTILASICIGKGDFQKVDSVIQEMVTAGIEPTVVTFNAIISGCARSNLGSAAFEWFHRMKVRNIDPNEITYEMLIEALTRDAKPRLAYELYLRADIEGLHLSPKAYDAVIESCHLHGADIDLSKIGPRPLEKRKMRIRKILPDSSNLADSPRISKPFDREELYKAHKA